MGKTPDRPAHDPQGQWNKTAFGHRRFGSILHKRIYKKTRIYLQPTQKGKEIIMNAPVDFKAIEGMFQRDYEQLEVRFDPKLAIAWTYMNPSGAPCFNTGLL